MASQHYFWFVFVTSYQSISAVDNAWNTNKEQDILSSQAVCTAAHSCDGLSQITEVSHDSDQEVMSGESRKPVLVLAGVELIFR